MGWRELHIRARDRYHGAFPVRLAPTVGLTPAAVTAYARRQRYDRPYPGIIVIPGYRWDHRTQLSAVQLYVGSSAAASDLSAAWLYGLVPQPPSRPQLLVPHGRRVTPPHATVRRSRCVDDADLTTVDRLRVVTPEFLLVAISPRVSFDTLLGFAFDARQRGLLAEDALAARLDSVGRRAPGRSAVVRVHAALLRDGSDSMFESRVRARLRDAGYTPSSAPHPVTLADGRTVHLDIAFPAEQVAIECQGFIAHHSQQQLDRDARRDNRIALASRWRVLKLTRHRFRHDWPSFLTELDTALEARR